MEVSDEKKRAYTQRLVLSRMRVLQNNGFYGLLLMHADFALDFSVSTAATDGNKIYISPKFMDEISDRELDFVLMHEILHIALQHCSRLPQASLDISNIACDIVVNSNILKSNDMDLSSITLKKYGESMHLTPNDDEGYLYTAEQVYAMLLKGGKDGSNSGGNGDDDDVDSGNGSREHKPDSEGKASGDKKDKSSAGKDGGKDRTVSGDGKSNAVGGANSNDGGANGDGDKKERTDGGWDDHDKWGSIDYDELKEIWKSRVVEAAQIVIKRKSKKYGDIPSFAQRMLMEINSPQTDWRTILQDFVQEEINDYSFSPPDKRYDGPFFLPDFNEKTDVVEDILFMIDTSASMSDKMISVAFDEIKGAIEQFNGALKGWLGFFDAVVTDPQEFENIDELKAIRPIGGGGTNFYCIFQYVERHMQEKPPASIIILTDGYASFPPEKVANKIPVLWLLNNEDVTPPWGKIARIKVDEDDE